VGLAERLRAEKSNPQADVYWGNEPFHTINLAEEGVLAAYESPIAKDVAAMYRDPQHRWAGNGLRVRVIVQHRDPSVPVLSLGRLPLESLTHPSFKNRAAMARPTAGTTGGHVGAIYLTLGDVEADALFRRFRDNGVNLLGGNSVVAQSVAEGTVLIGLTDNDDAAGAPQGKLYVSDIDPSTLSIPTTVGLVAGAIHPDNAKKLIDYLLSAEVERKLIDAKFAGWSVRGANDVKAMDVDYREVARVMPHAVRRATAILEGRDE
jgi:iron(III) transport system substrate-binding protein